MAKSARRKRKGRITMPGGESVPQRATGRDRTHTNQPTQDARMTAMQAHERMTGVNGAAALDPALATDLGRCIVALCHGDERATLLDAWQAISAAHRQYRMMYIGQTGDPQGAAIGFIPERMETDPSLRVDLRTHDERVSSAKAGWAAWDAKIHALPWAQMIWAIGGALNGFMGESDLWRDQQPTMQGRVAVDALRRLV
jgi:hypothetical protein